MNSTMPRVALVTGASRGIGRGIALELAANGYNVVVSAYRDKERAELVVNEIQALGRDSFSYEADVANGVEVIAMFEQTFGRFGRLDVLVNNAGIQTWRPLLDLQEEEWDRVLDTNLKGCFLCTKAAGASMKKNGGGAVVNIGSGCNRLAFPRLVDYTASKGGIEMFTKVAAVELGPFGIRVNCVAPGATETERTLAEATDYAGTWAALTPLRRIGTPADVAHAVIFLASEAASFITGQTLGVDGGLYLKPAWPYD